MIGSIVTVHGNENASGVPYQLGYHAIANMPLPMGNARAFHPSERYHAIANMPLPMVAAGGARFK